MIRRIEIWDFECHAHSVIDCLSPGLNLIFGESDSGKTSIVRALRLAAYNDFDPRCVRTGKKNCKVRVETEKGWVEVTRGKDNIWETCLAGESPQVYTKIGKSILPRAAEILGLHIVELGDMSLPVNVMDQNEGHFMLNELGGDSASGSMRAQIVDEISGLSGIEGLIKGVSLDRHRFGRLVKENEDHAAELRATMHDQAILDAEKELLTEARGLVEESDAKEARMGAMADLFEEHYEAEEEKGSLESQLSAMPNTKVIQAILMKARRALTTVADMGPVFDAHSEASRGLSKVRLELKELPDAEAAGVLLDEAREKFSRARDMGLLHGEHVLATEEAEEKKRALEEIPDLTAAGDAVNECFAALARAQEAKIKAEELADALEEMDEAQEALSVCETELDEAQAERDEALKDVDVCPLTDRPVSKECFKGMKFPVKGVTT